MNDSKNLVEKDREFSIIRNGVRRLFIYDPDLMSFAQVADANSKFGIHENIMKMLPNTIDEYNEAVKREAYSRGLACLLVEVDPVTRTPLSETYNMNEHPGRELMQYMKGLADYKRLEACKINFFTRQGHIAPDSMLQLSGVMKELEEYGIGKEIQQELLKLAIKENFNSQTFKDLNFIPEVMSGNSTKKKPMLGVSPGKLRNTGARAKKK